MPNIEDVFGRSKGFACPHCRKAVKHRLLSEEIGAVLLLCLGILLPIQYFADRLKEWPFWIVLAALVFELIAVMAVVAYLVRDKQRYEKLR